MESNVISLPLFEYVCVIDDHKDIKIICIIVLNVQFLIKNYYFSEKIKLKLQNVEYLLEKEFEELKNNKKIIQKELENIYQKYHIVEILRFTDLILDFKKWIKDNQCLIFTGKLKRKSIQIKYKKEIEIVKQNKS